MTTANFVCLIGKLTNLKVIKENKKELVFLEIMVSDETKSILPVHVMFLNSEMLKYLEVGYTIGVKGHLEKIDGSIKIIGEKITFLTSKANGEENE